MSKLSEFGELRLEPGRLCVAYGVLTKIFVRQSDSDEDHGVDDAIMAHVRSCADCTRANDELRDRLFDLAIR